MDQTTRAAAGQPARISSGAARIEDAAILILGASGDLTARKLIPALFALRKNGYLTEASPVIGVARREMSDDEFRREIELVGDLTDEQRQRLLDIAEKCPVHRTLGSEIRITTALATGE